MAEPAKVCDVEGCDKPRFAGGYCAMHYHRKKRGDADWDSPARRTVPRAGTCAVDGCGRPRIATGLCSTHYQRKQAGLPDWDGPIRSGRRAPKARAEPKPTVCPVDGCGRPIRWGDYCNTHTQRRKAGEPDWDRPIAVLQPRQGRTCAVEGCDRAVHSSGLCTLHDGRRRNNPDDPNWADLTPRQMVQPDTCTVEGCGKSPQARGLCANHYSQRRKKGTLPPRDSSG